MTCSKGSQWSFAHFWNTAAHSLLTTNLIILDFATFSIIYCYGRDSRAIWYLIGMLLVDQSPHHRAGRSFGIAARFLRNAIIHPPSVVQGKYHTAIHWRGDLTDCAQITLSDPHFTITCCHQATHASLTLNGHHYFIRLTIPFFTVT